jgi:hypothetical protein
MPIATRVSCLAMATTLVSLTTALTARCQSPQPKPAATAPATKLEPYTAPDQSASAGVPSGWKVTKGQDTVIQMTSPDGVTVFLGTTVIAKNAAFQPGQHAPNGIDMSMPYSAALGQKFTMILQQNAAIAGLPAPQIKIDSSTPLQLPAAVGQCGRFVADVAGQDAKKLMAVVCSLPLDSGGTYKNILLLAQAPAAIATQAAPTAQAVFQSYRIPSTWLQKKLAPFTAPPPAAASAAAAAMINRSTIQSMRGADNSANCFDLSVLRETPTRDLPRSCGGTMPD